MTSIAKVIRLRLGAKLFLIILLANTLLAGVMLYANNQAFTQSFEAYLSQVQSRRLAPLLDSLADEYRAQGGWAWIGEQPERWRGLNRRFLWPRHNRHDDRDQRRLLPLFQLRDARGELIWGEPTPDRRTAWLPIEVDGERVGELGVPVNLRLTSEFDQLFAEQQRRQFLGIALMALLLAAAVALPFAHRLTRPIARLQLATRQLAEGHFDVSLTQRGSDELAELAQDFNRLARRLKDNLSARQRWIADISHELRTPVSVLRAELEALQDGISEPTPETLTSLHQEICRLGGLIDDLHELSLSDAGALSYQMVPVDLGELIDQICAHSRSALQQRHIELSWRPPEQPIVISGDPRRLSQLLSNLMQNTLNYTDGRSEQPGHLHIALVPRADAVELNWSDSAPGVPEAELPRLFDRLYRVEGSRNRATGGSGLGLSIVQNVVHAHGGTLAAQASPLGGVAIVIRFPREGLA
ncbi:ATP-binding protein [Marinimicrobium sp. C6131]|uniref:ATP-binding protein n=1 Tax=Marinimicrobium sp. C6131 TaxID=3022676 RepID=UPI00223E7100|nr:ATP-binding protein [Marinimicrobium sp. C6131]UZJ43451.1 ATP-binding protein [Marinimicrobium sp. C6131]